MGDESIHWARTVDSAFGGWAQPSPPLAVWAFPIVGLGREKAESSGRREERERNAGSTTFGGTGSPGPANGGPGFPVGDESGNWAMKGESGRLPPLAA